MKPAFKYIYGPVPSWRLGSSLGIDLLSQEEKVCNFDCVYCQLGQTKKYTVARKIYVPVEKVVEELGTLPDISIDYITFSGRGEPALAANLGEAVKALKLIHKEPIAVITNGSLMLDEKARAELSLADLVIVKTDACSTESLQKINRPAKEIEMKRMVFRHKSGVYKFPNLFAGRGRLHFEQIIKRFA